MFESQVVPFGQPLNGSPHCVVSSMPKLEDVIAYEEGEPETISQMSCAYPRFVRHPLVRQVMEKLGETQPNGTTSVPLVCEQAAHDLHEYIGKDREASIAPLGESGTSLTYSANAETDLRVKQFLQHTGAGISSRWAEDWLSDNHFTAHTSEVKQFIARQVGVEEQSLLIANSGMSAIFGAFRAVNAVQASKGRTLWIQFGWLYVDTMYILQEFTSCQHSPEERPPVETFIQVDNLDALEAFLNANGDKVAGIITEVPTNPLMQTCDVASLRALATQAGAMLICDPTLATPYNINLLPHSDILTLSLTKYFACEADVMLGAIAINPASPHAAELAQHASHYLYPPYSRDINRLECQLDNFEGRMRRINQNTMQIAAKLAAHPKIRELHWAYSASYRQNYEAIARHTDAPGSILSFAVKGDLETFYNHLHIAKGPSFGARFSLLSPYLYLAHYKEVTTEAGRQKLNAAGLSPDLLRFSVGLEYPEEIWEKLSYALDKL